MFRFYKAAYFLGLLMASSVCLSAQTQNDLCNLQSTLKTGEHRTVEVAGTFLSGPETSTLTSTKCPDQTWVEFDLHSQVNNKKLDEALKHENEVFVVLAGEFYGPPEPDSHLPEGIRKNYHPKWGHLGYKTKLVVHAIREVKPLEEVK